MPDSAPTPTALDCWYLTGPTAAGKTAVGLELAERLGAEIVSLDSMTLYKGMDIGTAKPTPEDRSRIPHHLLDLVSPNEDFSLSDYLDAAHAKIAAMTMTSAMRRRCRMPLSLRPVILHGQPPDSILYFAAVASTGQ